MTPFRIYADTSVIGGVHDAEFADDSRQFMDGVRKGRFILLVSDIVIAELQDAPDAIRRILPALPGASIEPVEVDEEVLALRDAYLEAEIVGPQWTDDAAHVATATVAEADAIVSWNFTHIVRLDKMKAYNRVNERQGYAPLTIISPTELPDDDDAPIPQ